MNESLAARLFKGALAASFLTLGVSGMASATDHLLSINGATVTQPATITHAGNLTQPLVLSNFDGNPTLTIGTSQSVTVVTARVKMCKPGTGGRLEWLDQGTTVVGVTGTLTSGDSSDVPINGYRLTLSMTGISDTYGSANGTCSSEGAKTYTYTAGAVIEKRSGSSAIYDTILNSTYNFWNAVNGVPEPGTLVLTLVGLMTLAWFGMQRVRRA